MPTRDPHLQFQKWANEYGPIYSLILGTRTLIVLSTDVTVKDLLDKRSAIYSDRQDHYVGQTLCSGDLRLLMMRYGPVWRMTRKMIHSLLNISAAKSYVPYQVLENKQMLYEMLQQPEKFLENIRRYSNALTTSMVFGWRTHTYEDEKLQQLFEGFGEFCELNQGAATLADFYPILRYLPDFIIPTQKRAKELFKRERDLYVGHWLDSKRAIKDKTARPCFCVDMAKVQEKEKFSDAQAAYISGTLLEAGSDTTSAALYSFIQAMVVFPEVQKKAQEQIDKVVGPDRLPTMDDEMNLQYLRGCVKETLRWAPPLPLTFPHAVIQDDEYMGYHIPKGAGVLNNAYAIHNDPERHPNPRRFDPDRYRNDFSTSAESTNCSDATKRDHWTFGTGRRVCQGMHVADRSLFLGMSRLLWGFDIKPVIDKNGEPIIPEINRYVQGLVAMPEKYSAVITPRTKEKADMITKEWLDAETLLDEKTKQWKEVPIGMTTAAA